MFLDPIKQNLGVSPGSLLHVGANVGQEVPLYQQRGIRAYHVEPIPGAFAQLAEACADQPDQHAINACLDAEAGNTVTFNIASNSQSSSFLGLGRHAVAYPKIRYARSIELETTTVDTLVADGTVPGDIEFLTMDVQGAEERVLQGATNFLKSRYLWGLHLEVSLDPLYENGATFQGVMERLTPLGFCLRGVNFNNLGWSNALFLRRWWETEPGEITPLTQSCELSRA